MNSLTEGERNSGRSGAAPRAEKEPRAAFHLLFVCTGNTCRSPMALGLALRTLRDWRWSRVEVKSAGVAATSGGGASPGALRIAKRHGIDLTPHRSTQLSVELVQWADLILTMSEGHLVAVEALGGALKGALITQFGEDPEESSDTSSKGVLDPISGGDSAYEETFEQLRVLVERALERLNLARSR